MCNYNSICNTFARFVTLVKMHPWLEKPKRTLSTREVQQLYEGVKQHVENDMKSACDVLDNEACVDHLDSCFCTSYYMSTLRQELEQL